MTEPLIIDTHMQGKARITAAYVVAGERVALVESGPKSSAGTVLQELASLGIDELDWIVVTHVHLDHAGAAGTLARKFPRARVAVHEVGAPHLVDPSRLWASATRIYGRATEQLWGGIDPVPSQRIKALADGDKLDLGGRSLQAVDTPGHAGHHHALVDDLTGIVFTGDALGVRLPEVGRIRPATPPPEFDAEKAVASIARIKELEPASLWPTHFGPSDRGRGVGSVDDLCDEGMRALRQWEQWVRAARAQTRDLDETTARVKEWARRSLEQELGAEDAERLERTTSYRLNVSGYLRYLDKLEQEV